MTAGEVCSGLAEEPDAHWRFRSKSSLAAICGLLTAAFCLPLTGRASVQSTTTNSLSATIEANGSLSVPSATTLSTSGHIFANPFTGSATVQYRARTTSTGGGNLTLEVTQDFQSGGPSVAAGNLSYSCGTAGLGTGCALTTASTSSATNVVTLPKSACTGGGGSCSASNPNSVVVTFTIPDTASIKTGTFTATVRFTISAT